MRQKIITTYLNVLLISVISPGPGAKCLSTWSTKQNHSLAHSYSSSTTLPTNVEVTTEKILAEWGGNCTKKDWDKCSHLTNSTYTTSYLKDKKRPELGYKYHKLDCKTQPILCLHNGWTVTRCQLLCMRCNRDLTSKYDKYVRKEEAC